MPFSDTDIIDQIRKGAKRDFAHLVDRYKNRAMTLAVRMLHDREDAEEAVQDAFVRTYNGLEKFEGNAKFSTWFYRIVYNVCLSRLGKRNEEFREIELDERLDYSGTTNANPTLTETLEMKDLMGFVSRFIEDLPKRYSSVLTLFYFQELSYEEICEVTSLPLGTVKAHLFRARSMLYKRIATELSSEMPILLERPV